MFLRFRLWLIRLLVGDLSIVANCAITGNGSVIVNRDAGGAIWNNLFTPDLVRFGTVIEGLSGKVER